jgi:transposase
MDVIHARCAGLDVHKKTVVACVRVTEPGRVRHEVRSFATTTRGLLALADWLRVEGCTHAVVESTGVYWRSVSRAGGRDRFDARERGGGPQCTGAQERLRDARWLAPSGRWASPPCAIGWPARPR